MNETENYDVHFFGCSHMSDEEDYVYSHEIAERANRYDQKRRQMSVKPFATSKPALLRQK